MRALLSAGLGLVCLGGVMDAGPARAASPPWMPGDDIPGWSDYECELPFGANVVWNDLSTTMWWFTGEADEAGFSFFFTTADCVGGVCDGTTSYITNGAWAFFAAWDRAALPDRSQGWYATGSADGPEIWESLGSLVIGHRTTKGSGQWFNNDRVTSAQVDLCVSRFRPDELAGIAVVRITHQYFFNLYLYPSLVVVIPFDYPFAPGAGGTRDTGWRIEYGDSGYDDYWPWDEITDPDIRDAVYEMYLP